MDPIEAKNLLDKADDEYIPEFLRKSNNKPFDRKFKSGGIQDSQLHDQGGQYISRCNISLLSNYILYLLFITQTVAFNYFFFFSKEGSDHCYASYLSETP
jgi:hypothetical protein